MPNPNTITLNIGIITLAGIPFTITGRLSTSNLDIANVKIKKLSGGSFTEFADFTLASATPTSATIDPTNDFTESDLLLIQIVDGAQLSDRVSVDFSEDYTGNGATVPFVVPDEVGTYKLNMQTVNEDNFSAVAASREFVVGKAPDTANSDIELAYKPYLVKYTGAKVTVKILLQNASTDAAQGNYEVIFKSTKQ